MNKPLSILLAAVAGLVAIAFTPPVAHADVLSYSTPAIQTGDTEKVIDHKVAAAIANGDSWKNITTTTTTVVKSGEGVLRKVIINTGAEGATFTIYDNTAASGTKIATGTSAAQGTILYDLRFSTGCTIVTASAAADITVTYR